MMKPGLYNERKEFIMDYQEAIQNGINTKVGNPLENCTLVVPEDVTEIEDAYFAYFKLKEIVLPDSIKKIDEYAFCDSKIERIKIPEGITELEVSTFRNCKNLKEIILPETLKKIGGRCFSNCKSLKEICLPDGLEEINIWAFSGSSIKEIKIPATVHLIQELAFSSCDSLEKIYMYKSTLEKNPAFEGFNHKRITIMSLDTLLKEKRSFKEINNFYKDIER